MVEKALGYDMTNMTLVAFAGIVIKLFLGGSYSEDGTSGPAGAAMWGYGLVAIAVLSLVVVTFGLQNQMAKIQHSSAIEFIKAMAMNSLIPLLLLGVLVWLIYLNAAFFKRINQNKVASEYYNYSTVSTVLVIIQLIVLFKYLTEEFRLSEGGPASKTQLEQALTSRLASVTYLVTLANVMLAAIQNIILAYFSTDG